ncbi:MAG: carbonic anhydrase [Bryobacteraceae bacterium]
MDQLMKGLEKFQREVFPLKKELFERLASGQQPSTLFITCADSRVVPDLFTQSEPGEIFVIRNAGNIVPAYRRPPGGVTATIEFAVAVLGVKHIVICGHTDCGAMKALLHPENLTGVPAVADWLGQAEATRRLVLDNYKDEEEPALVNAMIGENVLVQLQNLQTHPSVLSRLASGNLKLYGWIYNIGTGDVESFDAEKHSFIRLDGSYSPHATPVARLSHEAVLGTHTNRSL